NATQNVPLTNVTVGSFTDPDPNAVPADYAVTIDWGDGTPPTQGTVARSATGSGFDVLGSHTYTGVPTFPITIDVHDQGSFFSTSVGGTTVNTSDSGGASTTINSTAQVTATTLPITGIPISTVEGTPFSGPVATFTPFPSTFPTDYSATID